MAMSAIGIFVSLNFSIKLEKKCDKMSLKESQVNFWRFGACM